MKFLKYLVWALPFALPLYLVRFRIGPFPTTALEIYLLILFIWFTVERGWLGWKSGSARLRGWRWPIAAWVLISYLSVFWSPSLTIGFGLWRAYVLESILVLIVVLDVIRTEQDLEWMKRSMFASCVFLMVWAVFQFISGWGIPHPWDVAIMAGRRATGPFPYPNALSLFVTPVAALAFVQWLKKPRDWWALVGWISGVIAIGLAKSDGGFIAWVAVAIAALLINKKTRKRAAAVFVLILGVVVAIEPVRSVIWKTISFQNWSGQVRLFQWRETWQMLKDHWFLGAGFGGYPGVFAAYHKATAIEIFQYPHNILFNFWSETGVLGVVAFGWIVGRWIRKGIGVTPPSCWTPPLNLRGGWEGIWSGRLLALAPIIAILIHGLVDVPYFKNDLAILFWILALPVILP